MFNYRLIARLAGNLLILMAVAMVLPIAVSLHYRDGAQYGLVMSATVIVAAGLLLRNFAGRNATYDLHARESYWITAVMWLLVPLAGALPYLLTSTFASYTDAIFESYSGFTTTGSSVAVKPEELPEGIRLWRSMTQWIGGLGLVLFIMTILRRLNGDTMQLYAAEFSGTQQRKLHPHLSKSVSRMWHIYGLLTMILIVLLIVAGNGVLDSVCLALSTVSTGGFMPHSTGLVGYSNLTMGILTVFMFLSGVNVALIYNFCTLHWRRLRYSEEFIVYLSVFMLAVAVCSIFTALAMPADDMWHTVFVSVCYNMFHIASTISTCGFYTEPPVWGSHIVSVVTFLLILTGAMAGSTGGGLKLRRLMTLVRYLRNYFIRMLHPNAVLTIKIDRQPVEEEYVNKIFGFVFLYILFILGGAFALTLAGSGIADAFCLAAANISNLGPSPLINSLGANLEYSLMPTTAKWTLIVLMLAGRLEIFTLLAVVSPSYWKRR
jgi:trk system potassium uptake protein TrkH